MDENELSNIIIGCAIKVHASLGPGLLESAYQECLYFELQQAKLKVEKEKALPLTYAEVKLDCGYRIDFFIEKKVIVEIEAVQLLSDIHWLRFLHIWNLRIAVLDCLLTSTSQC